jgi:hypothetical protein
VFHFGQDGLGSRTAIVDANRKLGDVWTDHSTSTYVEASDSFAYVIVSRPAIKLGWAMQHVPTSLERDIGLINSHSKRSPIMH